MANSVELFLSQMNEWSYEIGLDSVLTHLDGKGLQSPLFGQEHIRAV